MSAIDDAKVDAARFLESFDPAGDYDEHDLALIAAAIVYGRRLGLEEGRELMMDTVDRIFAT